MVSRGLQISLYIDLLGILNLSDLDSLTIFIRGPGGILKLYFRIGGILPEFGPKFQPLQQAHASQIVSHILRMWRLTKPHVSEAIMVYLR